MRTYRKKKVVEWPPEEAVPKSPEEAQRLGWIGESVELNPDYKTGLVKFFRCPNNDLRLEISYLVAAKLDFGSPSTLAELWFPTEPSTRKLKLFDVEYFGPKKRIVRLLAEDEDDAQHEAVSYHFEISTIARPPDKKRRKVENGPLPAQPKRRSKGKIAAQ